MTAFTTPRLLQLFAAVLVLLCAFPAWSQEECDGYRYRYTGAFDGVVVDANLLYGENININFVPQDLLLDIYSPQGDALDNRPLVLMAHGGFFVGGSKEDPSVVSLCEDLAQMGYVTASFGYRLGIDNFFDLQTSFIESVWRAVHDSRAAVRYFRKSATLGNPFRIDTNRIYLGGISAGGFIALHHAYVDEQSEIPSAIDPAETGLGGGLEGLSGNTGYSSEIHGVVNIAGALQTTDFLLSGANEPLYSIHGTEDGVVPIDEGDIVFSGFPVIDVDGSQTIHAEANALGMDECLIVVDGAGHVPHAADPTHYDLTLSSIAGKLGEWACEDYVSICGEYDYTADSGVVQHEETAPLIFPNPSSAQARVFVTFESPTHWSLFNALGVEVDSGVAARGEQMVWRGLAPGWYALKSQAGTQPLVITP